jgi:tetratricopeptide (TPR) repeat protein
MISKNVLLSAQMIPMTGIAPGGTSSNSYPTLPPLTEKHEVEAKLAADDSWEYTGKAENAISIKSSLLPCLQIFYRTLFLCMFLFDISSVYGTSYLEEGNQFYRGGKYENAANSYRNAISNNENPALSWFNLGNALYQSGNISRSISCYESAVEAAPDFLKGWQNLGILYYELEDYGACISVLEHVLAHDSGTTMIYSLLAASHKALEHYSSATVYLEKLFEKDSTSNDALLMLFDISRSTGDIPEALSWLSRYPSSGPRYNDVLLLTGELKLETADTTGALAIFRESTRLSPETMRGWVELVTILYSMKASYAAVTEAYDALEKYPSFTELAQLAGRIAFEAGFYDKAEYFFSLIYKNGHPDGVVGLGNIYNIYIRQGESNGISRITSLLNGDGNGKK